MQHLTILQDNNIQHQHLHIIKNMKISQYGKRNSSKMRF